MTEFKIGNDLYRAGSLNAIKQFHCMRKLSPCLGKLTNIAGADVELVTDDEGNIIDFKGDIDGVISPFTSALAAMSDEDAEYIFNCCLEVTERKQQGGAWAPLRVKDVTMFDGLSLPALLQIAYHVLKEDITAFFKDLPSLSGLRSFLKVKGLPGSAFRAEKTGS